MKKLIKSGNIQVIDSDWIPYKNRWGNWCWYRPDTQPDPNWPGVKAPKWAEYPINENGRWYWYSTDRLQKV